MIKNKFLYFVTECEKLKKKTIKMFEFSTTAIFEN